MMAQTANVMRSYVEGVARDRTERAKGNDRTILSSAGPFAYVEVIAASFDALPGWMRVSADSRSVGLDVAIPKSKLCKGLAI